MVTYETQKKTQNLLFILKNLKTFCKTIPTRIIPLENNASVMQHNSESQSNFPKEQLFSLPNVTICPPLIQKQYLQ